MTDILDATQQKINDASGSLSETKQNVDPLAGGKTSFNGPTPPVGSAVGRTEPPLPVKKTTDPLPHLPIKTGSPLDLTSKTEPIQSPPLPIVPPDIQTSSSGWSPEKVKREKEKEDAAPIANLPQYERKASPSVSFKNIPIPAQSNFKLPDMPIPSPMTPGTGSAAIPNIPPPPSVAIGPQTVSVVPPAKKRSGRGALVAIILFLAAAIPLGVLYVSDQQKVAEVRTQALGDLRYLCTPDACATGGCNQPCTANLAGTSIVWDGNAYNIPGNGYAILNKCFGVESGASNNACSCPRDNITSNTAEGIDTCDLPDIERWFKRGPATLGWDETYCGTQQVDITVGSGNPSYFHTKEDTRPETCAPSPTPTLAPPICTDGTIIHVYDQNGTDITEALKDKSRPWRTNESLIVGAKRVEENADHARFRMQPFSDWITSNQTVGEEPNVEWRAPITIPPTFNGTQVSLEVEICDVNNVCN